MAKKGASLNKWAEKSKKKMTSRNNFLNSLQVVVPGVDVPVSEKWKCVVWPSGKKH